MSRVSVTYESARGETRFVNGDDAQVQPVGEGAVVRVFAPVEVTITSGEQPLRRPGQKGSGWGDLEPADVLTVPLARVVEIIA